jgi:hypothetical protein
MRPSGAICLPADRCFSELSLYKSNSVCWYRTKRTSSSSHILPHLFSLSDYDWYYHFQCGRFYTKVYYLPFYLYHIITYAVIFNSGLDAKDLALHPEDKHLFRLAKLITLDKCSRLVIKLGLPHTTWNNNKIKYGYEITVLNFVALCEWKKLKYQMMSGPSFQELSAALAEDYHTHCICQVGNNWRLSYSFYVR